MHALEKHRQEVVERDQEGVRPLACKVWRKDRVLLGCGDKRQNKPLTPLALPLQLGHLLQEELLGPLYVPLLKINRKYYSDL